jgi:predicted secreted hydrolase
VLLVLIACAIWFLQRGPSASIKKATSADFAELAASLRKVEEGFSGDGADRALVFPADHGAHPRAAAETWDFAGWLRDADGHDFGFRLNFARLGLRAESPKRPSAWAATAAYRGLFSLADGNGGLFHNAERYERAALGLSGFDVAAGRLWLDGWEMQVLPGEPGGFALRAGANGNAVDLTLTASKAPGVPESGAGNLRAYVLSRLEVSGTLETEAGSRPVTGTAWANHAWGRLLPPGGQVALDRFQLQWDDGRELMILRVRRRDGSAEPVDRGFLIGADGRTEALGSHELHLESTGWWRSPKSRTRYPVRWTLRVPSLGADLSLSPLAEDQETEGTLRVWSGAVRVAGTTSGGEPVAGVGFVDVGGY